MTIVRKIKDSIHVITFCKHIKVSIFRLAKPGDKFTPCTRKMLHGKGICEFTAIKNDGFLRLVKPFLKLFFYPVILDTDSNEGKKLPGKSTSNSTSRTDKNIH